jgi:hypothetical protein
MNFFLKKKIGIAAIVLAILANAFEREGFPFAILILLIGLAFEIYDWFNKPEKSKGADSND